MVIFFFFIKCYVNKIVKIIDGNNCVFLLNWFNYVDLYIFFFID